MKIRELFENLDALDNNNAKTVGELKLNNEGEIVALNGIPRDVWQGNFEVPYNNVDNLESFEGSPIEINGAFTCSMHKKITTFNGSPKMVNGAFIVSDCNISSVEGLPEFIKQNCFITKNPIKTLKNIYKNVKEIGGKLYVENSVESNVLGVLKIKNLKELIFLNKNTYTKTEISNIINKYLPNPNMSQILDCQNELIEAGFEGYAEL